MSSRLTHKRRLWLTGGLTAVLFAGLAHALLAPPLLAWLRLSAIEARVVGIQDQQKTLNLEREPLYRPLDLVFVTGDLRAVEDLAEARLHRLLSNGAPVQLTSGGVEVVSGEFGWGLTRVVLIGDIPALERQLNALANHAPGLRIQALRVEDQGARPGDSLRADITLNWLWANPSLEAVLIHPAQPADSSNENLWRASPRVTSREVTWSDQLPFEPTHNPYTPPARPPAPVEVTLLGIASRDGVLIARLSIDGEQTDVAEGDATSVGVVERIDIDAVTLDGEPRQTLSLFAD